MNDTHTAIVDEALAYVEVGLGPVKATVAAFDGDRILAFEVTKRSGLEHGSGARAWRQLADLAGEIGERCCSLAAVAGRQVRERGTVLMPAALAPQHEEEAAQA